MPFTQHLTCSAQLLLLSELRFPGKASDEDHPYGHDRFECVASIILAILLGVTGVGIGFNRCSETTAGHYDTLAVHGCWHWRQPLFLSLSKGNHVLVYKKCSQED